MGLYKIDNVSSEEWQRQMMRRHRIRQWMILLVQIALMVGAVALVAWIMSWEVI